MAAKKKGKYFAWSNIHNGGKVQEVRGRKIVIERNMVSCGDPIEQSTLDFTDEEWAGFLEGGSVRSYPYPEGCGETESPSSFVLRSMLGGKEQLDPNLLLEMSLVGQIEEEEPASELVEA